MQSKPAEVPVPTVDLWGAEVGNGLVRGGTPKRGVRPAWALLHNADSYARFDAKVVRTEECTLWVGACDGDGYSRFAAGSGPNKWVMAGHRFAWERAHGREVPVGKLLRHACDLTLCVRPECLQLGDQSANMVDAVTRQRHAEPRGRQRTGLMVDLRGHRGLAVAIRTLLLTEGYDRQRLQQLIHEGRSAAARRAVELQDRQLSWSWPAAG